MNWEFLLINIAILAPAIILHEIAHGWVAYKLGDPTAKNLGRLTINPLKHIDPFGTIILPLLLWWQGLTPIGWAKPVPINPRNLFSPKRDMMWVGLAGPAVNILLAVVFSLFLKVPLTGLSLAFVQLGVYINLFLAIFNLVPIPPLDGSRFVMGLLPDKYAYLYSRFEPYGIFIILILFAGGKVQRFLIPILDWAAGLLGVR